MTQITAAEYDAAYYGVPGTEPKANYRGYLPQSVPSWSMPLASWLRKMTPGPYLDLGAAYGHLCRDLNRLALTAGIDEDAWGCEWSDWAVQNSVAPVRVAYKDARVFLPSRPDAAYGTVTSLDFLEHFVPEDTEALIRQIWRVTKPGGWSVHLIGSYEEGTDLSHHHDDPTHQNDQPMTWYAGQFRRAGFWVNEEMGAALGAHPAWKDTDWQNRWLIGRKG